MVARAGRLLAVNAGSSSLKYALFSVVENSDLLQEASGIVERIGRDGSRVEFVTADGARHLREERIGGHGAAARLMLEWLDGAGLLGSARSLAVGHRVVHGGSRFTAPAPIDAEVVDAIEALGDLAPLHNPPAVAAIRACRAALGDHVPMVAVFDTAFFSKLPPRARRYAIPRELADRHGIVRYGFHGLAHQYMTERATAMLERDPAELALVTLQLGAGCSAAAIDGGRPIDTTMGLTPLGGLVMATRSGSIDPSIVELLARKEGVTAADVVDLLNTESGLLGVSGLSSDMRDLAAAAADGHEDAAMAVDLFADRVRKQIGAYAAALGRLDAVIFGGGIGEHDARMRARICDTLSILGIELDAERNRSAVGREADIAGDDAAARVLVVPVDEMAVIARRCVEQAAAAL